MYAYHGTAVTTNPAAAASIGLGDSRSRRRITTPYPASAIAGTRIPTGAFVSVANPNAAPESAAGQARPVSRARAVARNPSVRKNVSIMSVTAARDRTAYS